MLSLRSWARITSRPVYPLFSRTQFLTSARTYAEEAEDDEEGAYEGKGSALDMEPGMGDDPNSLYRTWQKRSKKKLDAKFKDKTQWNKIMANVLLNQFDPAEYHKMEDHLRQTSKLDYHLLTPKHGKRFFRVWKARDIAHQNEIRKGKVFPK